MVEPGMQVVLIYLGIGSAVESVSTIIDNYAADGAEMHFEGNYN